MLLPEPWRQLWATTLGQMLAVVLLLYYRRKLKTSQPFDESAELASPLPFGSS